MTKLNPYDPPQEFQSTLPPRRKGLRYWVHVVLIAWTVLFVPTLPLTILSAFVCSQVEPPSFPGDPNIGLGLIYLASLLNIPTSLGWLIFWVARSNESSS